MLRVGRHGRRRIFAFLFGLMGDGNKEKAFYYCSMVYWDVFHHHDLSSTTTSSTPAPLHTIWV